MKLQVVACMHALPKEPYYCREQCLASLLRFGVMPIILGQEPYRWHWGGLGSKAKFLKRAIDELIIATEYIIFTDTFDVIYSGSPESILEAFLGMKAEPIIWGAEKACFSDASLAPLHPETPSSYKYLNSGWGMGEVSAIKAALDEMNPDETLVDDHQEDGKWVCDNDQNAWMRQMLFGTVPIGVDSECVLVQNYCGVTREEISLEPGGLIRNLETNTLPMVHHFNGPAKTYGLMVPVLSHLGL